MTREIRFPTARLPRSDRSYRRGVVTSVIAHVLVFVVLFWRPASDFDADRAPGGPGPRGGGGGGGSRRVVFISVQSPAAARQERQRTVAEQVIDLVVPEIQEIKLDLTPKMAIPKNVKPIDTPVLGSGDGTGGGEGAGTGKGGGEGAGFGTGIGNAVGPGTGGDGGNVFPPVPRYTVMPPLPRPSGLKGKTFRVRFWVNTAGKVVRVEVVPRIKNSGYRRKFLALMYEYTFTPATTRQGKRVPGKTEVSITL